MAKSSSKSKAAAEFSATVKVQVWLQEFEPLASLKSLDFKRLSKGNHKIEIGFVKGGCCRNLVHAIVKDGMVTGCEIEGCKGFPKTAPPRELLAVIDKARKKAAHGRKWKPIPVAQLVSSNARIHDLIIIGGGCILICIWGYCLMCCWYPRPHCFIPDIITGPL
jgi:hypothetical protein